MSRFDHLHGQGIDYKKRIIFITGPVNVQMYSTVTKNLLLLDGSGDGAITLRINSEGGDVTSCRAIYTAIRQCRNKIRTIVYGEASSAGSILVQAGDERVMTPYSDMMIHVGEETLPEGHPRNIDSLIKYNRHIERWIEDVYLEKIKHKKPRFTKARLKELMQFDTYLTPKQALELGLIDVIGDIV